MGGVALTLDLNAVPTPTGSVVVQPGDTWNFQAWRVHRYVRRFAGHDLVIVDELGYMPIGQHGADLLFQALSERHETGGVIANTNLPGVGQFSFARWVNFRLPSAAAAGTRKLTHLANED